MATKIKKSKEKRKIRPTVFVGWSAGYGSVVKKRDYTGYELRIEIPFPDTYTEKEMDNILKDLAKYTQKRFYNGQETARA